MKRAILFVQFALCAGCIFWLFHSIDWQTTLHEFEKLNLFWFVFVFFWRFIPWMMLGLRLKCIFYRKLDFMAAFKASLLCVGCNSAFPARAGELAKIAWMRGTFRIPYSSLVSGVFLERLCDLSALMTLSLLFARAYLDVRIAYFFIALLLAIWTILFWIGGRPASLQNAFLYVPLSEKIRSWIIKFFKFLRARLHGPFFIRIILATLLVWTGNYILIWLILNGMLEYSLTPMNIGLACVSVFFSSGLLLVPGGIGGMEVILVIVLGLMGIENDRAVAASMVVRFFYSVPAIISAILILSVNKLDINNIRSHINKA